MNEFRDCAHFESFLAEIRSAVATVIVPVLSYRVVVPI